MGWKDISLPDKIAVIIVCLFGFSFIASGFIWPKNIIYSFAAAIVHIAPVILLLDKKDWARYLIWILLVLDIFLMYLLVFWSHV